MSLFSSKSFAQPPLTSCASAIALRLSPLTTLYSPSPFSTFLPVGVVTVFFAAGRSCEREACWLSVERVEVSPEPLELFELLELPEPLDELSLAPPP